jgi:predicted ArsR family transcriptional regulator
MALGSAYDGEILRLLALTPMTATQLAHELEVDDGALTLHLVNDLLKAGLVKVVGADGPSAKWGLTDKGRQTR